MDPTPAHNLANLDLLSILPICSTLVEVGSSSGSLAREYKLINPSSTYIGVEIEPSYVEQSSQYCDHAVLFDFNKAPEEQFPIHQYPTPDCWIFGDTLEHLIDPWSVLEYVSRHITPDGSVCACIPNMQHWSVQIALLSGRLNYQQSGLLDRTHLRWFTRSTIIHLFESTGFSVDSILDRVIQPSANSPQSSVLKQIASYSANFGLDPATVFKDSLPIQYVVKAVIR